MINQERKDRLIGSKKRDEALDASCMSFIAQGGRRGVRFLFIALNFNTLLWNVFLKILHYLESLPPDDTHHTIGRLNKYLNR